jgi:hypothetical protein
MVDLGINIEKSNYLLLSLHGNAGQNRDMRIENRSLEKFVTVQIFGNDRNKSKLALEGI